jgi:hypothetical protein
MTERGVFFVVSGLLVSSDRSLRVPFFPQKGKNNRIKHTSSSLFFFFFSTSSKGYWRGFKKLGGMWERPDLPQNTHDRDEVTLFSRSGQKTRGFRVCDFSSFKVQSSNRVGAVRKEKETTLKPDELAVASC